MKKFAFVLVAMLAMVFTGCKTETAKITVYVEDELGMPVAGSTVLYADYVSLIVDGVLPSPEELVTGMSDCFDEAVTNVYGMANIDITMSVSKLKYYFLVYNPGTQKWMDKTVELHRGQNEEIDFYYSGGK